MFIADLAHAERPAILVGGGAYGARAAIVGFAERHNIPCFRTWNAQDVVTDDARVYCGTVGTYGGPGRNFGIQNCDLLLSLGCRMSGRITGGQPETFARGAKKYIVDVDTVALTPQYQEVKGDVNVQSTCEAFMSAIGTGQRKDRAWLERCMNWRERYDPVKPEMLTIWEVHHYGFMRVLSDLIPANAIVVSDTGGNVIMMGHCFRSKRGQRIFSSNGNTPMGFSMCGAIGAWFADRSRPVICIIGDGGMNMNIQELQTMMNYGCNVKVFIVNNRVLGNTKSYQRVNGMKEVACGPDGYVPPDFVKVSLAYGVRTFTIPAMHMIEAIYGEMMLIDGPAVCDVVHDDFCKYEPRLSVWEGGIEEMYPPLPKEEFLSNMLIPPVQGWEQRRETMR